MIPLRFDTLRQWRPVDRVIACRGALLDLEAVVARGLPLRPALHG